MGEASEAEKAAFEAEGAEDDDDAVFQWWWEASVPQVEKAAEEAEGGRFDSFAAAYVSDGLGGNRSGAPRTPTAPPYIPR